MVRFSANLSMMFNEASFLDRFERAAAAGFKGVEFMFPYEFPAEAIAEKLDKFKLEMVLHNLPAGDWAQGERGIACLPGREGEYQASVGKAIEYAKALKCKRLHCFSGISPKDTTPEKIKQRLVENLRFAAQALDREGIHLLIEPINDQIDMPGYYLTRTQQARDLMRAVNHPNIYLQYDIYHMQIMEGNITRAIQKNMQIIDHIQLADNPGRHEPGTGEINYRNLFCFIEEAGYKGWIGCEYKPAKSTEEGLAWMDLYQGKGE